MLNKKLYLLLLLTVTLAGCNGLDYDWGTRLIYEGVVTNRDGEPLQNIVIKIHADDSYYDSEVIASAKTDENGHFEIVFPPVKEIVTTTLLINRNEHERVYNAAYSNIAVTQLPQKNINDYKIDFGTIQLFEVQDATTLTVVVNNASVYDDYFFLTPAGLVDNQIIDYTAPLHPFYRDYDSNAQENTLTYYFKVAKNQLVHLRHRNAEETEYEDLEVPVDELPVTVNIEY